MLFVDIEKCSACRRCEKICPSGAIKVTEGKAKIDNSLCNDCYRCVYVCPKKAISEKIRSKRKDTISDKEKLYELSITLAELQKRLSKIKSGLSSIGQKIK